MPTAGFNQWMLCSLRVKKRLYFERFAIFFRFAGEVQTVKQSKPKVAHYPARGPARTPALAQRTPPSRRPAYHVCPPD